MKVTVYSYKYTEYGLEKVRVQTIKTDGRVKDIHEHVQKLMENIEHKKDGDPSDSR